jgi:thiol-disulfide isomerase/thioredoxin
MGKASRTKVESTRREKIAAQRAAERKAEQRRRILLASGSVVVVLAVVLVFVIVKLNHKPNSATGVSNGPTGSALTAVVDKVTSVSASTLDTVGSGNGAVTGKPTTISGSTLMENGKPEMLYVGAEYCPYCAAERWAMIVALSRFGTFTGLSTVHSSSTDTDPNTPTFTFYKSSYTSQYLTFTPIELTTNVPDSSSASGYVTLQTPTAAQQAIVTKYGGTNSPIPFVDFGNHYLINGVSYDPGVLAHLSWATIASDLSNPNSPVTQAIGGTANYITAAICKGMTNNTPATACTSTVQSLESQI